jgi:hypothetical protein
MTLLFANVVVDFDGNAATVCDNGEAADNGLDVRVVALGNTMNRHKGVED